MLPWILELAMQPKNEEPSMCSASMTPILLSVDWSLEEADGCGRCLFLLYYHPQDSNYESFTVPDLTLLMVQTRFILERSPRRAPPWTLKTLFKFFLRQRVEYLHRPCAAFGRRRDGG
jgi:hypothetical protein